MRGKAADDAKTSEKMENKKISNISSMDCVSFVPGSQESMVINCLYSQQKPLDLIASVFMFAGENPIQ